MATRQYIGARYVPIFTGDWDASKVYEPLTIVYYGNASYTSKKLVPAGTLPTNTEYWVLSGTTTGQIVDLQNRISAVETEVDALEIASGKDDIWVVVSDSYGTVYPESAGSATMFDYMKQFSGRTSSNLIGLAYSGCGFINTAGGGTFLSLFTAGTQELSEEQRKKVSKVVVAAGRNDYISDYGTILAAEKAFYDYAKANYPNAEIIFAFIAYGDGTSAGSREQQIAVYDAYRDCTTFGAKYMLGSEAILHNAACMASDGIHPSPYGKQMLGKYLVAGIINGDCNVCYPRVTVTYGGSGISGNLTTIQRIEHNILYIELAIFSAANFSPAQTLGPTDYSGKAINIPCRSNNAYALWPVELIQISSLGTCYSDTSLTQPVAGSTATLQLSNNALTQRIWKTTASGSATVASANNSGFGSVAVPAVYA